MDSEKTNKENRNFILSDIVKRKILDMYNISKENVPQKAESEDQKADITEEQ